MLVSSKTKLGIEAVRDAVGVVGFELASVVGPEVTGRGTSSSDGNRVSDLGRLYVVSSMKGVS